MARAFTPSRSMIYGAPVRQAWQDVGNIVMGQLVDWSDEQIRAEYDRQVSNAGIAIEAERQNLKTFMLEHQKDPGSYQPEFAKQREQIRKSILDPITQPDARRAVSLELNEAFADWESWLGDSATRQTAVNRDADWEAGKVSLYESREYTDEEDVLDHWARGVEHIEDGFGGNMPVSSLPTREVADLEIRQWTQHVFGNYFVQRALATDDPTLLDRVNESVPESVFDGSQGPPLFGPAQTADLKSRYKGAANAAKAEARDARKGRADAFEQAATNDILAGKFTFTDEKGNVINWRDAIIANQDISAATKRTLEGEYTAQTNARAGGKEYTDLENVEAYNEIAMEPDPEKRMGLIKKHVAAGYDYEEAKPFLKDLHNPKAPENSTATAALDAYISAVRSMRTQTIKRDRDYETDDERARALARMNADLALQENGVLLRWRENPDLTPEQRIAEMEALLAPVQDEAAKETMGLLRRTYYGLAKVGYAFAGITPPTEQAPPGLEAVWPQMSAREKQDARTLLARGVSAERIIEVLK